MEETCPTPSEWYRQNRLSSGGCFSFTLRHRWMAGSSSTCHQSPTKFRHSGAQRLRGWSRGMRWPLTRVVLFHRESMSTSLSMRSSPPPTSSSVVESSEGKTCHGPTPHPQSDQPPCSTPTAAPSSMVWPSLLQLLPPYHQSGVRVKVWYLVGELQDLDSRGRHHGRLDACTTASTATTRLPALIHLIVMQFLSNPSTTYRSPSCGSRRVHSQSAAAGAAARPRMPAQPSSSLPRTLRQAMPMYSSLTSMGSVSRGSSTPSGTPAHTRHSAQ